MPEQIIAEGFPLQAEHRDPKQLARLTSDAVNRVAAIAFGLEMGDAQPTQDTVVSTTTFVPLEGVLLQIVSPSSARLRIQANLAVELVVKGAMNLEIVVDGAPVLAHTEDLQRAAIGEVGTFSVTVPVLTLPIDASVRVTVRAKTDGVGSFIIKDSSLLYYTLIPTEQ